MHGISRQNGIACNSNTNDMTVHDYTNRMRALGIERGQLGGRFREEAFARVEQGKRAARVGVLTAQPVRRMTTRDKERRVR